MRIAIYDSGVGGLSIFQAVSSVLPEHEFIFLSDNQAFPYGTKPEAELLERVHQVTSALIDHYAPDVVIVACNTASTIALASLRESFNTRFIGVVPAIKPAAEASQSGHIAVLATPATASRAYTKQLIADHAGACEVHLIAAPTLVNLAESKIRGDGLDELELARVLQPIKANRSIDCVVLACTHFPLLRKDIETALGDDTSVIAIIDSNDAIARRTQSVIDEIEAKTSDSAAFKKVKEKPKRFAVFSQSEDWTPEFLAYLEKLGFEQIDLITVQDQSAIIPAKHKLLLQADAARLRRNAYSPTYTDLLMTFAPLETSANLNSLLAQVEAVLSSETDYIANAANLSSILFHAVEDLNWVGFYFLRDEELVLGPFQGQLACTRIKVGEGVCGKAYAGTESLMVNDVLNFDGHIACDAASRSEIVVPFYSSECSGVLDIDSPSLNRFNPDLLHFFEQVAALYRQSL